MSSWATSRRKWQLFMALALSCVLGCKRSQNESGAKAMTGDASILQVSLVRHQPDTLLGGELGLDHVGIAFKNLEEARRIYLDRLGFGRPQAGRLPNGLENVNLYFADGSYIELLTYYDAKRAAWLAQYLEKYGGGASFALLSVYSIDETRAFLDKRGFSLGASFPGRIKAPGVPEGDAPLWHTSFFSQSPLPGGRLGFIAYDRSIREPALKQLVRALAMRRSPHPNTARRLRAIWMMVNDLEAAQKAYSAVGLTIGRSFEDSRLKARGIEVIAGQGAIFLLQPTDPKGEAAAFLRRRGESIAGLSVEVLSLPQAKAFIEKQTGQKFSSAPSLLGNSFLISPELAGDVWLEMVQR